MDGSRRSAHGNAYFTGIGRNKRIVFFDTLLARIDGDEIEAVLAHELGHFRLHHVRQRLAVSAVSMLAGLALLGWLARQPGFYTALGVPAASPAMALLLFAVVVPVFMFFATPLEAWWSRRHEREADDFAVRTRARDRLAGGARQAVPRQRLDIDAGSGAFGVLRFASAGARAHRAPAPAGSESRPDGPGPPRRPSAASAVLRPRRGAPERPRARARAHPRSSRPTRTPADCARSRECPRDRGGCAPAGSRFGYPPEPRPRTSP